MGDKPLSQHELRKLRESIYARAVHNTVFLSKDAALGMLRRTPQGGYYPVPPVGLRDRNFQEFVKSNFKKHDEFDSGSRWPANLTGFAPYETLKCYARTDYGAMMIKRVLEDNKTSKTRFTVTLRGAGGAEGNENTIFLPEDFGTAKCGLNHGMRFGGDGQKVDYMAIIHHEFRHTKFWGKNLANTVSLDEERDAVLYNENPVRIINGYEPRYTYFDGKKNTNQTINIITGKRIAGKYGIKADNPAEFVLRGAKGSMTEFWK